MLVKRERQIPDHIYESIPQMVKEAFPDHDSLKYFADAIIESSSPPPAMGEMTQSGRQRLFSPISPYNGFTGLGLFMSADIPLKVLDLMRRDSQVALGMAIVKFPITQLKYTIVCDNPAIKTFVKANLHNQWATIIKDSLKALDFGFIAFEKVWDKVKMDIDPGVNQRKMKNRTFITLKKLKPIHPSTISIRVDNKGNFSGINQDRIGEKIVIPRNKSMMIVNDEEFGNFFGRSRMVSAYESWYWKQISTQFFLRYTERFSIPPYKVFFPNGITRFANGTQMDNASIAMKMAEAISSYGNVAVPSMADDKGNKKWDIEAIQQSKLNVKPQDIVGFWDLQILRGLLIPDEHTLSAMDPDTASKVYLSTLAAIVTQIEEKINEEIVKPLVDWNFTDEEKKPCYVNIDDIDFKKREEMRKLASKILDLSAALIKNKGALPFNTFPDMSKIWDSLGVPQAKAQVTVPELIDINGKVIKPEDMNNNQNDNQSGKQGPDKKERTSGNSAREGRDGTPRDQDKQDDQI